MWARRVPRPLPLAWLVQRRSPRTCGWHRLRIGVSASASSLALCLWHGSSSGFRHARAGGTGCVSESLLRHPPSPSASGMARPAAFTTHVRVAPAAYRSLCFGILPRPSAAGMAHDGPPSRFRAAGHGVRYAAREREPPRAADTRLRLGVRERRRFDESTQPMRRWRLPIGLALPCPARGRVPPGAPHGCVAITASRMRALGIAPRSETQLQTESYNGIWHARVPPSKQPRYNGVHAEGVSPSCVFP
jgi:hypothetical protein